MSWIIKGCPRCNGDLYVTIDYIRGTYYDVKHCLQCGYEEGGPECEISTPGSKGFAHHKKLLIKN